MIKVKILVSLCIALFIFFTVKEAKSSPPIVNIIVILDTSNRVSEERHPGQAERDKEIARSIVDIFGQLVSDHFNTLTQGQEITHPHRLTFVVPKQPRVPAIPQSIMRKLTIENQRGGMDTLITQKQRLLEGIDELYVFVKKQNKFPGADIWDWFRADAKHYLLESAHNYIICLSDGYLNFDRDIERELPEGRYMRVGSLRGSRNWRDRFQGLLPINKDFSSYNAKFLMVEITLQSDSRTGVIYTQDFEIIEKYWNTWFKSMGIAKTKFIEQLNPDILRRNIDRFINTQ